MVAFIVFLTAIQNNKFILYCDLEHTDMHTHPHTHPHTQSRDALNWAYSLYVIYSDIFNVLLSFRKT